MKTNETFRTKTVHESPPQIEYGFGKACQFRKIFQIHHLFILVAYLLRGFSAKHSKAYYSDPRSSFVLSQRSITADAHLRCLQLKTKTRQRSRSYELFSYIRVKLIKRVLEAEARPGNPLFGNLPTASFEFRETHYSDTPIIIKPNELSIDFLKFNCLFTVPPDILDKESSSDVTLEENSNTILSCRAAGRPTPRIVWRREDGDHIILRNDSEATKGQNQICNIRVKRPAHNAERNGISFRWLDNKLANFIFDTFVVQSRDEIYFLFNEIYGIFTSFAQNL